MRVLMVAPRGFDHDAVNYTYLFPLGLAYISSVLKRAGHEVDCLNVNHFSGLGKDIVQRSLTSGKPYDFLLTGGLSTSYRQIKMVTDAVHESPTDTGLILGGGIISSEPELMFNTFKPGFIVMGEGESTIVDLLACLENQGDLAKIAGIGYRSSGGKFIANKPRKPIEDLDAIPLPDFEGFEFENYLDHIRPCDHYFYDHFDNPRVYPIICSRSCPFRCTFCFHPIGNKYRQRSVDSVMEELAVMVKRYRINTIAIYDELFSNNLPWVQEFCRRIVELFKELSWECKWCCQMRVDTVDEEMLQLMKDAGCYMVSYGLESHSQKVLKSMKKHITSAHIDQAVSITLRNNLSLQGNFIFGDVAETAQTAQETLDYWKQNSTLGIVLGFISPYPGSEIYQRCLERGIIKDKLDFIENHITDTLNMTEAMTAEEFEKLRFDIHQAELRYRIFGTLRSVKRMSNGLYNIKGICPHCHKLIEYSNYLISFKSYVFCMMYCRACRHRFYLASRLYRMINWTLLLTYDLLPGRTKVIAFRIYRRVTKTKPFIKRAIQRFRLKGWQADRVI